ncbi:UDP-glycosyltransferase 91D2-like [Rutidosis leptorrhynchoides]|uniref:UDP-glycosyltransferase 91D2-like n=1 Tax=Rutidosis leptorrhynchoides TaxID=125765 RepID=UPI003A99A22D
MATTTTTSDCNCKQLHVAMFPWLAFGHMIPFLRLSKFIAERGHKVSFLSTKRNIQRLPELPSHLKPFINLVELTFPHVPELPFNAQATLDVRIPQDVHYLLKAVDGLKPEVARFLEQESPDWIIHDFFPYWLPPITTNLGISRGYFSVILSCYTAFGARLLKNGDDDLITVEDLLVPPKWVPFQTNICCKKYEANKMLGKASFHALTGDGGGVSNADRVVMAVKGCDGYFIKSCHEFESQWLTHLQDSNDVPVVPVGLLPPETSTIVGDDKEDKWMMFKNWLDGQPKGRVVYVALGSEIKLNKNDIDELALGLELSELPFFWVLRKPAGSTESYSVELPDGFLERTCDRGIVWTSWVPQLEILRHESVGCFLTHGGTGSIVEGLMMGHPLVMLPMAVEQSLNSRLVVVEKQVGIEVPRNDEDGSFTKESVAKSLIKIVVDDEGKIYKKNAMALGEMCGDRRLHKKYVDDFIDYLEKQRSVVASIEH